MFHSNSQWTRKYIDSLPDSAFLYIDEDLCTSKRGGKSHPLSCRKFPYRDRQGRVDLPHLRNAIARAPQSNLPIGEIRDVQRRGRQILAEHGGSPRMAANGRRGYRRNSELTLHATPYDPSYVGFYFKDFEDFEEQFERDYKRHGVEEYEIQFIDGSSIEGAIFEAMEVNQANLQSYFEMVDEISGDDDRELAFYALNEMYPGDMDYIQSNMDEVMVFEGTPKDYAYELIDDVGMNEEWLETYFDYEAFGRDVAIERADVASTEEEIENLRESGDEDDEEEADRLQEWVDEVESWSDRKRGEEFVDSLGGLDQINNPENYFDYDYFARDLVIGGDVVEFRKDGTDYVITNASSL